MWIWIILAFVFGGCTGAVLMGVCCANNVEGDPHKKRWWEDEQCRNG